MKLICINAELAVVYGLPAKDVDEKEALTILGAQGLGQVHLDSAIEAGAFKKENTPLMKQTKHEIPVEVN